MKLSLAAYFAVTLGFSALMPGASHASPAADQLSTMASEGSPNLGMHYDGSSFKSAPEGGSTLSNASHGAANLGKPTLTKAPIKPTLPKPSKGKGGYYGYDLVDCVFLTGLGLLVASLVVSGVAPALAGGLALGGFFLLLLAVASM